MTADETKGAIDGLKGIIADEADSRVQSAVAQFAMDLLQGFLLDVKAIADEHRRMSKAVADFNAAEAKRSAVVNDRD